MRGGQDLGPLLPPFGDEHGLLHARRVWPQTAPETEQQSRDAGPVRLVVEAIGDDGRVVAATVEDGVLELVRYDHHLPTLEQWRARPAARLIAHRAGKRAVLSVCAGRGQTCFVKLARRGATDRAAQRLEAVRQLLAGAAHAPAVACVLAPQDACVLAPEVARVLPPRGTGELRLSALPGRPVRDVIIDSVADAGLAAERAGLAVGRAMSAFALPGEAPGLPPYQLSDELDVLERWVSQALAHQVVRGRCRQQLVDAHLQAVDRLAALSPGRLVLTHRDLHDGQVLVDASDAHGIPAVAFLDLDTAASADAGLDLANLLAHLDLLAGRCADRSGRQGPAIHGAAVHAALVRFHHGLTDALHRHDHPVLAEDPARVEVLRAATRVRLAAVHAFRPDAPGVVPGLLAPPVLPPWTGARVA